MTIPKRLLLFIPFVLLLRGIAVAQTKPLPKPQFIALFVNNLDSTVSWYTRKLGFTVIASEKPSAEIGFAMLSWGDFLMEVIHQPKVVTRPALRQIKADAVGAEGFFKLGFWVDDLSDWEKTLRSRGVTIKYPLLTNERFRMRLFIAEDPEGNLIQFYNRY